MTNFQNLIWNKSKEEELLEWKNTSDSPTCLLDEIGQKYNCDKSNSQIMSTENKNVPGDWNKDLKLKICGHNYLEIYYKHFECVKNKPINLLEIGMGNYPTNGNSLRMWLEFFPNAKITILDHKMENFNLTDIIDPKRVETFIVDQSSDVSLSDFVEKNKTRTFDFIIDDGSHQADHQILTLKFLFPLLAENGVYFIEDIHDRKFNEYLSYLFENLNNGELSGEYRLEESNNLNIKSIEMYRSLICLHKGKKITR